MARFELAASRTQTERYTKLSYIPVDTAGVEPAFRAFGPCSTISLWQRYRWELELRTH